MRAKATINAAITARANRPARWNDSVRPITRAPVRAAGRPPELIAGRLGPRRLRRRRRELPIRRRRRTDRRPKGSWLRYRASARRQTREQLLRSRRLAPGGSYALLQAPQKR